MNRRELIKKTLLGLTLEDIQPLKPVLQEIDSISHADLSEALLMTVIYRNEPLVKWFLKLGANPNVISLAMTPLCVACSTDSTIANLLLKFKADPEFCDSYGHTPLMKAAEGLDFNLFENLLNQTKNTDKTNQFGQTALTFAIHGGELSRVSALIKHGADPNLADSLKFTPLMIAVLKGHPEIVLKLLPLSQLESTNHFQQTALLLATLTENITLIKLLLQAGADKDHRDASGKSAVSIAKNSENEIIKQLLGVNHFKKRF